MQAEPFLAPLMVMHEDGAGAAVVVGAPADSVPVSVAAAVSVVVPRKQSVPEVGQSPQLPRTMFP